MTPELGRWEALVAGRTRGGADEGIAFVLGLLGVPGLISFAGGFPDPATFPREHVSALFQEFAASGEASAFQYAPTRGLAGPLDALAGRLEQLQGRRPAADELLITQRRDRGPRARRQVVHRSGETWWSSKAPTYLGAIQAFRSYEADAGRRSLLHEHGLDLDDLERRLASGLRPKLLYTIPDHQNPAGVSLTAERRALLVELASRYGFLVVEDVAYRELGFAAEPLPSLWSLAPDVVVQTGTTSKTLFPGVRLGWAVGPAEVSARLVSAKQNTDQCAGALGQRLFEESVRRGWLDEQVVRSRALYRANASGCSRRSSGRCRRRRLDPAAGRLLHLADAARGRGFGADRAACGGTRRRHRPGNAVLPGRPRRGHDAIVVQHGRDRRDRRGNRTARSASLSRRDGSLDRGMRAARTPKRVQSVVARGLAVVAALVFVVAPVSAFGMPAAATQAPSGAPRRTRFGSRARRSSDPRRA